MSTNVQIAQRILNLCSSLAISCMHKGLKEIHMVLLQRAYKVDLTLLEVDEDFKTEISKWTERLLMMNLLAFSHMKASIEKALSFILEAQRIAT